MWATKRTRFSDASLLLLAALLSACQYVSGPQGAADGGAPLDGGGGLADGGVCARTYDSFELQVVRPDGTVQDCAAARAAGAPLEGELRGTLVSAAGLFTVRECDAVGDGGLCRVHTFVARPFSLNAAERASAGTAVRVRWRFQAGSFGCTKTFVLTEDRAVGGAPEERPRIVMAAVDGNEASPLPAQVQVVKERLDCEPRDAQPGFPATFGDFAFVFTSPGGRTTRLEMGQSAPFDVPITTGRQTVLLRNLRSYQPYHSDDYWNWAWMMTAQ